MKSHARVVVIGGGVVGVSTLYHLAKKGWSRRRARRAQGADLGLDLACGGPAAALQHELLGRPDPQILGRASTRRSRRRPASMSASASVSNIRLARTKDRWDEFMYYAGVARDDRRQGQRADARAGEGDLAALRDRRHPRRHPASRRRLYPARRPDAGAGQGRAQPRARRSTATRRSPASSSSRPANGW